MPDIRRIPFTELYERLQNDFARDGDASLTKYQGRINDQYTTIIPSDIDWRHIRKEATILTTADYNTGHISVTSGSTFTGASTSWTSANSNGMLIKVSGFDELYRMTYSAGTTLTSDRAWVGTDISSNTTYSLFQDRYALASDYERLILDPNQSIYYWLNGNRIYLKWRDQDFFEHRQTYTPNQPAYYAIKWIDGDPYIFIDPPSTQVRTLYYVYIPTLVRMTDYQTGTITTLSNGSTAVTGSGTDFDGFITDTTAQDYYFRIDSDGTGSASVWHKVASVSGNTSLTLTDAYVGATISSGASEFTISVISLLPSGLDMAFIYGAAIASAGDKSNKRQIDTWSALMSDILGKYKSIENKQNYGHQRVRSIYEKAGVRR